MNNKPSFYQTGHRGCRGLFPENTLKGFLETLRYPVNAIELDIVVSKDHQLVVSHEPYMHPDFCLLPSGKEIAASEEKAYNLFHMSYAEIKTFDCGSKPHPRFPQQQHAPAYKPLLEETIETIEAYCNQHQRTPIIYDIELKSEPGEYGISQPEPAVFAEMVAQFIRKCAVSERVILRSFDAKPLQYLHQKHPQLPLAYIIENNRSAEENLAELGFIPYMYSPDYTVVTEKDIAFLKENKCTVVPWTVNSSDEITKLLHLGVDGIITDYPNLFKSNSK